MAKATYKCAKCGELEYVVERNRAMADRKAAWLEKEGACCDACRKAAFAAEHAAKVAAAEADPKNAALPALTGSPKQVAWAQALRLEAIPRIEQARDVYTARLSKSSLPEAVREEVADALALIAQELIERQDARDWIDGRDRMVYDGYFAEQLLTRPDLAPSYAAMKSGA